MFSLVNQDICRDIGIKVGYQIKYDFYLFIVMLGRFPIIHLSLQSYIFDSQDVLIIVYHTYHMYLSTARHAVT